MQWINEMEMSSKLGGDWYWSHIFTSIFTSQGESAVEQGWLKGCCWSDVISADPGWGINTTQLYTRIILCHCNSMKFHWAPDSIRKHQEWMLTWRVQDNWLTFFVEVPLILNTWRSCHNFLSYFPLNILKSISFPGFFREFPNLLVKCFMFFHFFLPHHFVLLIQLVGGGGRTEWWRGALPVRVVG